MAARWLVVVAVVEWLAVVAYHTGRDQSAAGGHQWRRDRALEACHWARLGCGVGRAFQSLNKNGDLKL